MIRDHKGEEICQGCFVRSTYSTVYGVVMQVEDNTFILVRWDVGIDLPVTANNLEVVGIEDMI